MGAASTAFYILNEIRVYISTDRQSAGSIVIEMDSNGIINSFYAHTGLLCYDYNVMSVYSISHNTVYQFTIVFTNTIKNAAVQCILHQK